MEQRAYHGPVSPEAFSRALLSEFGGGGYQVQQLGDPDHLVVQIGHAGFASPGGQTSITVHLVEVEDGVLVRMGQQAWLGVAASLGTTALAALRNPFSLLGRLDDLAEDINSLQLKDRIWQTLDVAADSLGASLELSEALRRSICEYCNTPNPVGAPSCLACGAPLGDAQPLACPKCGFVSPAGTDTCPECGTELGS
jgi:ribosomal protein L40E